MTDEIHRYPYCYDRMIHIDIGHPWLVTGLLLGMTQHPRPRRLDRQEHKLTERTATAPAKAVGK
jgi:hypothetical protein